MKNTFTEKNVRETYKNRGVFTNDITKQTYMVYHNRSLPKTTIHLPITLCFLLIFLFELLYNHATCNLNARQKSKTVKYVIYFPIPLWKVYYNEIRNKIGFNFVQFVILFCGCLPREIRSIIGPL